MRKPIHLLSCVLLTAAIPAAADDFPRFRGPDSSGIAEPGPGLADSWPEGGPPLLWKSGDLGVTGWDHDKGQIAVAGGLAYAYTRKQIDGEWRRLVTCFTPDGEVLWQHSEPARTPSGHQTPSPTLCVADGRVFGATHTATFCLDAETGEVLWNQPVGRCRIPSPLVVRDVLVYQTGPTLEGLSTATGEVLWTVPARGGASLQSPTVWHTRKGTYVVSVLDEEKQLVCVDPVNGEVLWDVELNTGEQRIQSDNRLCQATPTVNDGWLIINRSERRGTMGFRLHEDQPAERPELVWWNEEWRSTSPLIHQDFIYCGYTRRTRAYAWCLELATGERLWYADENDSELEGGFKCYGDPILADGKIFCVVNKQIFLFRPDPQGLGFLAKTPPLDAADTSSPAIADGRLYVLCYSRGGTARVACLDIAAPPDAKPVITQTHLPASPAGNWYHKRLWVSGGNGMRSWRVASGKLPAGLSLDPAGYLTGVPESPGEYDITLAVSDEDGDTDQRSFGLTIRANDKD